MQPLVGQNHADPELYTSLDFVAEPSVASMMQAMKDAKKQPLVEQADLMEFDYRNVGPMMLNVVQETHTRIKDMKEGLDEGKKLVEEIFCNSEEKAADGG
jgi:hypothetical protein